MKWYYCAKEICEDTYGVVEVYVDDDGKPMGHTDMVELTGETKEELIAVLEMALNDIKNHEPITESNDENDD